MKNDYKAVAEDLNDALTHLDHNMSETLSSFSEFGNVVLKDNVLPKKTKLLISLAIAIIKRSPECVTFYIRNLLPYDISRDELLEIIAITTYMDGGPSLIFGEEVLTAFEQLTHQQQQSVTIKSDINASQDTTVKGYGDN